MVFNTKTCQNSDSVKFINLQIFSTEKCASGIQLKVTMFFTCFQFLTSMSSILYKENNSLSPMQKYFCLKHAKASSSKITFVVANEPFLRRPK